MQRRGQVQRGRGPMPSPQRGGAGVCLGPVYRIPRRRAVRVVAERSRFPRPGVAPCSCPPARRPPLPRNPPRAAAMVPVCGGSAACWELQSRHPGTCGGRCSTVCAQKTTSPRAHRAGRTGSFFRRKGRDPRAGSGRGWLGRKGIDRGGARGGSGGGGGGGVGRHGARGGPGGAGPARRRGDHRGGGAGTARAG